MTSGTDRWVLTNAKTFLLAATQEFPSCLMSAVYIGRYDGIVRHPQLFTISTMRFSITFLALAALPGILARASRK